MSDQVLKILEQYGEKDRANVWAIQGNTIVKHSALERVAAKAGIKFLQPSILRAEREEAVILVTGELGDRTEWSIGEALVNANYRVSGKQAAYVYAMAEKRAKDRVILKLVGLHGLAYSEDEADDFKASAPVAETPKRVSAVPTSPLPDGIEAKPAGSELLTKALILAVERSRTADDLRLWWASEETQANFKKISAADLARVKEAKAVRWAELTDGVPA